MDGMAAYSQNALALGKDTLSFSAHGRNREKINGHSMKVGGSLALAGLTPPRDGRRRILDRFFWTQSATVFIFIRGNRDTTRCRRRAG
jgi:hypothetical protein